MSCETSSKFDNLYLQNRHFPTSFLEPRNLLPQNRYFVRCFRQFSSHLTNRHACHGIRTLSPLCAALTMRFAKKNATRHVQSAAARLRLPRKMEWRWTRSKCRACGENCNASSANVALIKYCACHARRLSTRYKHVHMPRSARPAMRNETT